MASGVTGDHEVSSVPRHTALAVPRAWPEATVRLVFGAIWAIDASLKWRPSFRATYLPNLVAAAAGQPHWLAPWFAFWLRVQRPDPVTWAYLAAVAETLIAAFVLLGAARKPVYAGGVVYSLMVWSTAGGFGGPYAPGATDIGPAVIYAVVFSALLAMGAQGQAGRYSLDALITARVPWWHQLGWPGTARRPWEDFREN